MKFPEITLASRQNKFIIALALGRALKEIFFNHFKDIHVKRHARAFVSWRVCVRVSHACAIFLTSIICRKVRPVESRDHLHPSGACDFEIS